MDLSRSRKQRATAISEIFSEQARVQRCRIHKVRNVTERLPKASGAQGAA